MKRFWKRGGLDIETELRAARPEPAEEFVRMVEGRVSRSYRPRGARLVLAMGVTLFALVPFAALGGFGEMADAAKKAVGQHNATKAPSASAAAAPARKQYVNKVRICHKPGTPAEKEMQVPESALKGHLGHGDIRGRCP